MSHTLFAKPKNTLPQHLPPFYAQSVMRLSFFFTLRQTPPLFLIRSAAISLSLNTRHCYAISLSLNTLRCYAISLSLNTRRCCAIGFANTLRSAGLSLAGDTPHYAAISLPLNTRRYCAIGFANTRSLAGLFRYRSIRPAGAAMCSPLVAACAHTPRIALGLLPRSQPRPKTTNPAKKRRTPPNGRGSPITKNDETRTTGGVSQHKPR